MTTIFGQVSYQDPGDRRPLVPMAERIGSPDEAIQRNNDNLTRGLRCALPAQVIRYNASKQTVTVQPLIRERIINRADGTLQWVDLPVLEDVPVCFPQAGNFVLTMPVQAGDEVLIVFSDMCLDQWWAAGGVQNWWDRRRHDLSDGIAVIGLNSVPRVIPSVASNAAELRTKEDGAKVAVLQNKVEISADNQITINVGNDVEILASTSKIEMTPDGGSSKIVLEDGKITLHATEVAIEGKLTHNGNDYLHHVHGGVYPGGASTSGVTEVP